MPDLDQLEQEFREAYRDYADTRSEEDKERYKEAKQAFSDARVAQRQDEEADPDHPRGQVLVSVNNDDASQLTVQGEVVDGSEQ